MNLLIIEDERGLLESIKKLFEEKNFIVDIIDNGEDGYYYALNNNYDAIILDIMLPKMNGLEVLKKLRENKITTPILILTAKQTEYDELKGLNLGADDYLSKPFSFDILYARIMTLLRRGNYLKPNILEYNNLILNLDTCLLLNKNNNKEILLSSKEFHLLNLLIKNINKVISKEEIIEKIWGYDFDKDYNTVEVYISFLRKKIAFLNSEVTIKSLRNLGYKLE